MTTQYPNVSVSELLDVAPPKSLSWYVKTAHESAGQILMGGEMVRREFNQGNANTAPESSTIGALHVADHLVAQLFTQDSEDEQHLFGTNFRRLKSAIKALLH